MENSSITASLLGLVMVLSSVAGTQAAELKVLAGGSMTVSLNELKPRFEQATGHKLTIVFDSTPNLIKAATSGAPFDLGVVPVDVMKDAAARAASRPGRPSTSRGSATASPSGQAPPSPTSARPRR